MVDFRRTVRLTLTSLLVFGTMSVGSASAQDLSRYRSFQFGTKLATVATQAGVDPSQATLVHSRPALIQELEWRPQQFSSPSQTEAVRSLVFTFYNGELFQVAINYDPNQVAGMTSGDMVEAISANYGAPSKPTGPASFAPAIYGDEQAVLARWQNAEYRFDLIRGSFGPSFRLVGVLKRLETPFRNATIEAARLDQKEAPQREAARLASADVAEKAKLEQDRLVNKPKFRP